MIATINWKSASTVALLIFGAVVSGSIGACSYKSHIRHSAFQAVKIGDTEAVVISHFGTPPAVRETSDALFSRYASRPCSGECKERLWFENRLSLDTEAWSVELDKNNRVIKKSRWNLP